MAVEIRRIQPHEWKDAKSIRLEMLADTPSAYLTTLAEAAAFEDHVWIDRAVDGSAGDRQATYLGYDQMNPVAMAVGLNRDVGGVAGLLVFSVYVKAAHRGTAVASELMAAVEDWGRSWKAPLATLWVTETNERARGFYEKIGYHPTGDRKAIPRSSDIELRLEKHLPDSTG